ncbi:hypothetical protein EVAR_9031_1 [Eumeta japonica]|uniref:Uncharacterized protein n=1 Tax=Eumeta variegata TaxID=151549 RepID=A0A4C1TVZ4_EUMVA|nr:hypothetical protein EVAR_9031_1 [Eumeta japonica]
MNYGKKYDKSLPSPAAMLGRGGARLFMWFNACANTPYNGVNSSAAGKSLEEKFSRPFNAKSGGRSEALSRHFSGANLRQFHNFTLSRRARYPADVGTRPALMYRNGAAARAHVENNYLLLAQEAAASGIQIVLRVSLFVPVHTYVRTNLNLDVALRLVVTAPGSGLYEAGRAGRTRRAITPKLRARLRAPAHYTPARVRPARARQRVTERKMTYNARSYSPSNLMCSLSGSFIRDLCDLTTNNCNILSAIEKFTSESSTLHETAKKELSGVALPNGDLSGPNAERQFRPEWKRLSRSRREFVIQMRLINFYQFARCRRRTAPPTILICVEFTKQMEIDIQRKAITSNKALELRTNIIKRNISRSQSQIPNRFTRRPPPAARRGGRAEQTKGCSTPNSFPIRSQLERVRLETNFLLNKMNFTWPAGRRITIDRASAPPAAANTPAPVAFCPFLVPETLT